MIPKPGDSQALPTVAVIGGGASGVLAAIRLLGSAPAKSGKLRILIVERRARLGRGAAYGTKEPFHLLNVRHGRMSAFPEDPDHFSRWIARTVPGATADSFQPRFRYGEYLASVLDEAKRAVPAFRLVNDEAKEFVPGADGKIEIRLRSGSSLSCDRLLLAPGHGKPAIPGGLRSLGSSARIIADPWEDGKVSAIAPGERILVVGAGLTAVDFVLSRMRAGHHASIDLVSRRGLPPLSHPTEAADFPFALPLPEESLRGVFRSLRSAARAAGDAWPGVIDRFRSEIHRIWERWGESERRRFLRHARTHWETRRHRVAPEAHREWDLYRRAGKIRLEAGRILDVEEERDGIRVRIARRGGETIERRFDRIVNCAGAEPDLRLFEGRGYARDPLGLGVPTDSAGRPFRADGTVDRNVFILGPALRSRFWEMTAIPDLSVQAKVAVDAMLESFG